KHGVACGEFKRSADDIDAAREHETGTGSNRRVERSAESPVEAVLLQEALRRFDDSRLDDDLAIRNVDRIDEVAHRCQVSRDLTDDQLIRALIDNQTRARRGNLLEETRDIGRTGVRQLEADGSQRNVEQLFFLKAAIRGRFLRES